MVYIIYDAHIALSEPTILKFFLLDIISIFHIL